MEFFKEDLNYAIDGIPDSGLNVLLDTPDFQAWDEEQQKNNPKDKTILGVLGYDETSGGRCEFQGLGLTKFLTFTEWPIKIILDFCNQNSLRKLSCVSRVFRYTIDPLLEEIAVENLDEIMKTTVKPFVEAFAAFEKLEHHVQKFGVHAFLQQQVREKVVYTDMLLGEGDMRILHKSLASSTVLGPLAHFAWCKYGFKHFKIYLEVLLTKSMTARKKKRLYNGAFLAVMDILTVEFQVQKITLWPVKLVKHFVSEETFPSFCGKLLSTMKGEDLVTFSQIVLNETKEDSTMRYIEAFKAVNKNVTHEDLVKLIPELDDVSKKIHHQFFKSHKSFMKTSVSNGSIHVYTINLDFPSVTFECEIEQQDDIGSDWDWTKDHFHVMAWPPRKVKGFFRSLRLPEEFLCTNELSGRQLIDFCKQPESFFYRSYPDGFGFSAVHLALLKHALLCIESKNTRIGLIRDTKLKVPITFALQADSAV